MRQPLGGARALTPSIGLGIVFAHEAFGVMLDPLAVLGFRPGAADQVYLSVDRGGLDLVATLRERGRHGPRPGRLLRQRARGGECGDQNYRSRNDMTKRRARGHERPPVSCDAVAEQSEASTLWKNLQYGCSGSPASSPVMTE